MRVLLLLDSYREDARGLMVYRLCQRWTPMRELTLSSVALGDGGPLQDRISALGVDTAVIPREIVRSPKALREEGKRFLFRRDRPDVLHSHCLWPDVSARLFHNGNQYVPLVTTIHDIRDVTPSSFLQEAWRTMRERQTRSFVSAFVLNSRAMREAFDRYKVDDEKIHLIPMGVDAIQSFPVSGPKRARFRALLGVEEDTPIIVSSNILEEDSGHLDLVDAMPRILKTHPRVRLFLIGEGPMESVLKQRAEQLGIADSVRVIGKLSEILSRIYSTADIVVNAAREPGFALDIAEAQASGTPVVATAVGANLELIKDAETGLLVPPADPDALADAIEHLLNDPDGRRDMGHAAREYILTAYELGRTATAYTELWRQLNPDAMWQATDTIPIEELHDIAQDKDE